MRNDKKIAFVAFLSVFLVTGCDDDASFVSALDYPGNTAYSSAENEEPSSSSKKASSSSKAKESSSSAQSSNSRTNASSSSVQSSSSKTKASSSSVQSSSSKTKASSSSVQSSSSKTKASSSSVQSSSSKTKASSSSIQSSSSEMKESSSSIQSSSSRVEESSSDEVIDSALFKPKVAYSQTGVSIENNNGCIRADGGIVTISCGGTYEFSGSSDDGQIVVNTLAEDSVVHVRLNNLTLKNSTDAPFFVISSSRTIVKVLEGTVNTFEDAGTRSSVTYVKKGKDKVKTDTTNACIYAKDDLTINGKGTLKIVANYKNGIHTTNDLRIRDNPTIDVHARNNALKGKGSVDIEGGAIVLKAIDGVGIKSDEGEDENSVVSGKGSVRIKGGKITVRAGDNGIEAYNEIVVSDEVSVPEINVNTLEKGLKASVIKMGNAITTIRSDGDGWKVVDQLEVFAGFHYMSAGADGIDVQNVFLLKGGTVIIENQSEKESASIVAFDSAINVEDGTLLGFGKGTKAGFVHNMAFTAGKYYGTARGAFSPSFDGTVIVVERDEAEIGERNVDGWQSICFPKGSKNCYYYK